MKHKLLSLYMLILIICSNLYVVSAEDKEGMVKSGESVITFQEFVDDYDGNRFISYDDGDIVYIKDIISDKKDGYPSKNDVSVKFESNDTWAFYGWYMDKIWEGFEVGQEVNITLHVVEKEGEEYCEEIDPESMKELPYRITDGEIISHASPSVTIVSPNGNDDWTGNSNHTIIYNISGGAPPYNVNFSYSIDHIDWNPIDISDSVEPGNHIYNWTTPVNDSENVSVMVNVTDNVSKKCFDISENFTIDSTPPKIIVTSPANNSSTPLGSAIMILFDESVNRTSVENAFKIEPDINNWHWDWVNGNKLIGTHDGFEENRRYNCTVNISAKDDSDPGNYMASNYFWSFTAQPGIGDFNVTIDYLSSVEAGMDCQIVVKIKNSIHAENRSGALLINFCKRSENGTFTKIGEAQFVNGMLKGENATRYSSIFSFESTGKNYIKINITSTNPLDRFENKNQYYEVTYTVNVYPAPLGAEEKSLPWEQLENIRVLIVVIMVFLIVILGYLLHIHRLHGQKKL